MMLFILRVLILFALVLITCPLIFFALVYSVGKFFKLTIDSSSLAHRYLHRI